MAKQAKITVSRRAVVARLNRKLAGEGKILRGTRGQHGGGQFHLVDTKRNSVGAVDIERLARKLGVLREWEKMP